MTADPGAPETSHWEDDRKLASWTCLCPGNKESGGKRLSGRTRKGNRWLRRGFYQMAWAASRKKGSYFKAQFARLSHRRGAKRAILAVAHTLVRISYDMLRDPNLDYRELGEDFLQLKNKDRVCQSLVKRLSKLGYTVVLTPNAVPEATT